MNPIQLILLALKVSILLTVFALGLDASLKDSTYLFCHPGQLVRSLLPTFAKRIVKPVSLITFPERKLALAAILLYLLSQCNCHYSVFETSQAG